MNLPNKLTVLRMIMVPIFIVSLIIFKTQNLVPFVIFLIASITDFFDGNIARKYNLVTNFGKFLDPVADKLLTLSAFIMLIETSLPAWAVCIIVAREISITGFRVIAAGEGITIAASPFGKLKTVFQFISILLLLANFKTVGLIVFYIAVILTVLSGYDYLHKNKKVLDLNNI